MEFDSLKTLSAKDRYAILDALFNLVAKHWNQAIPTNSIMEAEETLPQHLKKCFLVALGEWLTCDASKKKAVTTNYFG